MWNLGNYLINAQMSGVLLDEEAAGLKQKFFEKFQLKFEEAVVNFESLGGISAENRSSPNDKCNYQEFDKLYTFPATPGVFMRKHKKKNTRW